MVEKYAVVLSLCGKPCLCVGGGVVAEGKIRGLLKAKASITVIAPEVTSGLMRLINRGEVNWEKRRYRRGDLEGFSLVFAASDDPEVNREVAREAELQRALCNVVDNPKLSSFFTPAIIEWEGIFIAIGSEGKSPFVVRFLREWLEHHLPRGLGQLLRLLEEKRQEIKNLKIPLAEKRRLYRALFDEWYVSQKGGHR